jgi:hypothetical protein
VARGPAEGVGRIQYGQGASNDRGRSTGSGIHVLTGEGELERGRWTRV